MTADESGSAGAEVLVAEGLDVEAVLGSYRGQALVARALHVADSCPPLEGRAIAVLLQELRSRVAGPQATTDVRLARSLLPRAAAAGVSPPFDAAWLDQVDRRAGQHQERLQAALHNYKCNVIRESIRIGHTELAEFHVARGELTEGLKHFFRCKEYGPSKEHRLELCLHILATQLSLQPLAAASFLSKAEAALDEEQERERGQLHAAAGLVRLAAGEYHQAALRFAQVPPSLADFSHVLAPREAALYASLCALASLERHELKSKFLEQPQFKELIELVPRMREALMAFYSSRFGACLTLLNALRPLLALDVVLAPHVETLLIQIRRRALVLYFKPFQTVRIERMARDIGCPMAELEQELYGLIVDGQLLARIDSQNKVLQARSEEQRALTFRSALLKGAEQQRASKAFLLRANMRLQGFVLQAPRDNPADGPPPMAHTHGSN